MKTYKIRNWDENFEGSQSRTYNNKSKCSMPTKHGLGYKRLIRSKNGTALFGAWCALVQVLSRHNKPRKGYCTENGKVHGRPYSGDDLEVITDVPKKVFNELFPVAQSVGWLDVMESTYTTDTPEQRCADGMVPSDSDSNLDLNLDSNPTNTGEYVDKIETDKKTSALQREHYPPDFEQAWALYERKGTKAKALRYWNRLAAADRLEIIKAIPAYIAKNKEAQYRKDFDGWINPANKMWENEVETKEPKIDWGAI